MSGVVIRREFVAKRVWRIIEMQPGQWRGELHEQDRGIIRTTEVGTLFLVKDAIERLRQGLPMVIRHYRCATPDNGPAAA